MKRNYETHGTEETDSVHVSGPLNTFQTLLVTRMSQISKQAVEDCRFLLDVTSPELCLSRGDHLIA